MGIENAIQRLNDRFQSRPLNYTVEHSLVADLQQFVHDEVGQNVPAYGLYHSSESTNYKQKYLDRLCRQQSIPNVQIEVNVGESGRNRRVDLAVLRPTTENPEAENSPDSPAVSIQFVNGTKYYQSAAVQHAVEVKYIKNQDLPSVQFGKSGSEDWGDVDGDLSKLGSLTESVESSHLVIVSNKNIFQQEEADEYSTLEARDRYETLQEECERHGIRLTEIHPEE